MIPSLVTTAIGVPAPSIRLARPLHAGFFARVRDETAELETVARELGVQPEHRDSLLGTAHRAWVTLRSSLSANCDGVLLEECERGEEVALMRYRGQLR